MKTTTKRTAKREAGIIVSVPGRENNDGTETPTVWFVVGRDSHRTIAGPFLSFTDAKLGMIA